MSEAAISHASSLVVSQAHTAAAMGSGDLPVLATPALVALMENAAMVAARDLLADGETTVGSSIDVKHLAPSPVGATVVAEAILQERDDRCLRFNIKAMQDNKLIGEAVHVRYIVNSLRFMAKI